MQSIGIFRNAKEFTFLFNNLSIKMVLFMFFFHADLFGGLVMLYVSKKNSTTQQCVTVCHCSSQQRYC